MIKMLGLKIRFRKFFLMITGHPVNEFLSDSDMVLIE
jgi:hypothetical protein